MKRALVLSAALVAAAVGPATDAYGCDSGSTEQLVREVRRFASDAPAHPYSILVVANPGIVFKRFHVRTGAMTPGNRWKLEANRGDSSPLASTVVTLTAFGWSPVELPGPVTSDSRGLNLVLRPADESTRGEFLETVRDTAFGFGGPAARSGGELSLRSPSGDDALVVLEREGVREYRAPAACVNSKAVVGNVYERPVSESFVTIRAGEVAAEHFVTAARVGRFSISGFTVFLGQSTASSVAWTWARGDGSHAVSGTFAPVNGSNVVAVVPKFVSIGGTDAPNDFRFSLEPLDGTIEWSLRSADATGPCDPSARATLGGSLSYAEVGGQELRHADFALGTDAALALPWRPFYFDADGDGYGTRWPDYLIPAASAEHVSENDDDCDDADPARNPDAQEICDGKPNRCDVRGPGDGPISNPPPCPLTAGVCGKAKQACVGGAFHACTAASYGADYEDVEDKCDGLDNDCDGEIDEGCEGATTAAVTREDAGCGCASAGLEPALLGLLAFAVAAARTRRPGRTS